MHYIDKYIIYLSIYLSISIYLSLRTKSHLREYFAICVLYYYG